MKNLNLHAVLNAVAGRYPKELVTGQRHDIPRISFHIRLALDAACHKPYDELELCDLGGGIGLFSGGCAACGVKRTILVDDFNDAINHQVDSSILDLHKSLGVEVISRDMVEIGIGDIPGSFDIITTFDSMEHWHHSPKKLFNDVVEKLKPGGVFVLGVPNCVNMKKRLAVPLGMGKWSEMLDWYEADRFRGHVREPDVDDLRYIARDMGLSDVRILGRNWCGHYSENLATRLATKIMEYPLRLKPSLCSDIYMVGRKTVPAK